MFYDTLTTVTLFVRVGCHFFGKRDFPIYRNGGVNREDALPLGIQVVVGEGETIEQALIEFRKLVEKDYDRRWYKRRYGYFEKPSQLRRKRIKHKRLRGAGPALYWRCRRKKTLKSRAYAPSKFRLQVDEMFARSGPTMTAGY